MAVVQGLEHLVDVKSNVVVCERLVESSEINVSCVYVLHDKRWCLSHWVSHDINKIDDVDPTSECL